MGSYGQPRRADDFRNMPLPDNSNLNSAANLAPLNNSHSESPDSLDNHSTGRNDTSHSVQSRNRSTNGNDNNSEPKPTPRPVQASYEQPNPVGRKGMPIWLHDTISLIIFVIVILLGTVLINNYVFQSFNVVGPSMEPTLEGEGSSDRLIVNRLPVTSAHIAGKAYTPARGEIIVFKNPKHDPSIGQDEYIVKRVIGLPGERVTVNNCTLLVHNSEHPEGFNPYPDFRTLASNDKAVNTCVDGDGTDVTVPDGEIFVTGDHRVGNYSMDSRDGSGRATLGTIPLEDIVGPVAMRIWPLNNFKMF